MEVHMNLNSEEEFLNLISEDDWMMDILLTVKSLDLPDWWVCAGFIRSKIWDTLHGYRYRTPLTEIDVIYFNDKNKDEAEEKELERKLNKLRPNVPWSVKNEARMHFVNGIPPYLSSIDAISKFPETATALGLKLDEQNNLILTAPHGIDDVINLKVKPTDYFKKDEDRMAIYKERLVTKNWKTIWWNLKIQH